MKLSLPHLTSTSLIATVRKHKRAIVFCLMALLFVVLLSLLIPARLARSSQLSNLSKISLSLQSAHTNLANFRQPKTIVVGQRDLTVTNLLSQLGAAQKKDQQSTENSVSTSRFFIATYPAFSITTIANALKSADKANDNYRVLVDYHESVFLALKPVLEYNPQADIGNPLMNNDQLSARINAARTGLKKAEKGLPANAAYRDTQRMALITEIRELTGKLEVFDSNRQKEYWYLEVATAQHNILSNRQSFWEQSQAGASAELVESIERINELVIKGQ